MQSTGVAGDAFSMIQTFHRQPGYCCRYASFAQALPPDLLLCLNLFLRPRDLVISLRRHKHEPNNIELALSNLWRKN
jgi:hypothetical protein